MLFRSMKLVIVMEGSPKTIPLIYNLSNMFKFFMMILLPLLLMRKNLFMWKIVILLCMRLKIRMFYAIVIFWIIDDATESYYERGKHGYMHLNNIKFPLLMLKYLKFYLFCLPMLATLCFIDLSLYKIPLHRKWVRLKCVSYLLLDALFCFNRSEERRVGKECRL